MKNDLLYKEIIERMQSYQSKIKYKTLGTEILLLALMSIEDSMTNLILKELNITEDMILTIINNSYYIRDEGLYTYTLQEVLKNAEELQKNKEFVYDEAYLYSILEEKNCVALNILESLEINGNQISEELLNALSYLEEDNKVLINLTKKAKNKELNKLIGREEVLNNIDIILSKKQKNNCMLIGPAGVGKSGIVEGLAYQYVKTKQNITIYQLDIGSLISGTKYRGDLEEKITDVMETIKEDNIILFIDEIHNIMNNNSENSIDIANLLKPYLARSSIKCIGATTIDEYYKTIAKDKALARRFKNIYINEPSFKETNNILLGIKKDFESFYNIKYSNYIIKKIVNSSKYLHNLNNPDKSIDLLDECGALSKKYKNNKVDIKILKEVVYQGIGINIKKANNYLLNSKLDNSTKEDIKKYLDLKTSKYITKMSINNIEKTKIINELNKIFNLNNENLLELDMNDYINEHNVSTLIGTSPGYVGYDDGGILSKQIQRHNINIIIFKNYDDKQLVYKKIIDKIINQGYIIDYQGNKLNFINTILIFIQSNNQRIGF